MSLSPRKLGVALLGWALGSAAFQWAGLRVPFFKLPQLAGEELTEVTFALARLCGAKGTWTANPVGFASVVSWILLALVVVVSLYFLLRHAPEWQFNPLTRKKMHRFRSIRRGYVAWMILLGLVFVACLDNLLVGKRALVVNYNGKYYFPFVSPLIPGSTFGLPYDSETEYRSLKKKIAEEKSGSNWVLMPPVPYGAHLDAPEVVEELEDRSGVIYRPGAAQPFDGRAYSVFPSKPSQPRQEWTYRKGLRQGDMRGWNSAGEQVEKGKFEEGKQVAYSDFTDGKAAELEAGAGLQTQLFPPMAPSLQHRHYLGTNTSGGDVLASLFGGLQQSIYVVIFYLVVTVTLGVVVGGLMGFFGGWIDLFGQRLIEIWSTMPFFFIVLIVSSVIQPQTSILVLIICLFSWVGPTLYMRTATYRERERDYVAATRLLGAGTGRILFKHILPNTIAVFVTLVPFMVPDIIIALAGLDFLGFGLPPDQPSWGRLLQEGTENFNYPWIVSSAFCALVFVLVLVTFVGEAVREAFDPKKFTTYQ
ncbi:ABC transporter permease subunit [Verrucomicrobium sp. BvORR034]|uniref:ABC transporter permease subunit n=1 Tax=Verrucomicrobium sp. BvORR034 TaxID=1396418 RepID=UPI0009E03406|nr:ABC transporter permease subunit [Verrucomicrobium sp. BvORR034]